MGTMEDPSLEVQECKEVKGDHSHPVTTTFV